MPPPAQAAREGEEDNGDIPPAFTEDLTNKGALTRLSNQVKVRGGDVHRHQITRICDTIERVVQQIPGQMRLPA